MEKLLDRFASKVVSGNRDEIVAYLKPLTTGELLQPYEWRSLMKAFNGEINSIEDAKVLLKIIKFAKKEYTSIGSQLRNAPEVANLRNYGNLTFISNEARISSTTSMIFTGSPNIRRTNDVRIVDTLRGYISRTGKNVDDLDAELVKIDPDFSYKTKIAEYDAEKEWCFN
ncbi:MAG: hypothetical protein R2877_00945 [Bdellovibrionota bacterium]